ncbi:unnamed protein product [Durusdinium trenchii]
MLTWPGFVAVSFWKKNAVRFFTSQLLPSPKTGWQVSSHGRVCDSRGIISSGYLHSSGYKIVEIWRQKWRVHRLVKITFHGLPKSSEAWQVHHVDGNRANNRLDNLRYVTPSENVRHSYSSRLTRSNGPARSKAVLWRPVGPANWTCAFAQFQDAGGLRLSGEEWRPMVHPRSGAEVPGRMVSSFGRITSKRGFISQGCLTRQGYCNTKVCISSLCESVFVHRLVAFAFLGPPQTESKTLVNHKDLDKSNNAADNLEWVSQSENMAHFYAASTLGHGTTAKPVWSRPHGSNEKWTWHHSMTCAAHELGLKRNYISKCTRGLQRQTGGFEFQLEDTTETSVSLRGEEWREINELVLRRDREACKRAHFN